MQYKNFGKFIRSKREKEKISLNRFAFACEIEPASLSNFETGKSDVLFKNLVKISNGFNMKLSELIKEFEKSQHKSETK